MRKDLETEKTRVAEGRRKYKSSGKEMKRGMREAEEKRREGERKPLEEDVGVIGHGPLDLQAIAEGTRTGAYVYLKGYYVCQPILLEIPWRAHFFSLPCLSNIRDKTSVPLPSNGQ